MFRRRLAALTEILLILAAGNIIGEALFAQFVPASVLDGSASDMEIAVAEGALILLRLGLAGGLGLLLLYYRRGLTPRDAGLTRNNHSLNELVRAGLLLGLVSSLLVCILFAVHVVVPLGEGLPAWWTYDERPLNAAFWVTLLGTSVLIPPLTEEIMARGYFRMRLVESYGVMAGVILTGLVFGLSHTRYLQGDAMLLLFMAIILINSVSWTYLVQKTGSIIPSLVAHSLSNGLGTAVLFNVWIPLFISALGVLIFIGPVRQTLGQFFNDLKLDNERRSIWHGLGIILIILITALILLNLLGRQTTLIILGLFCLMVTAINLLTEKKPLPSS